MAFDIDHGWQVHVGFRGDYCEGATYAAGDVVVRGGALWIFTPEVGPDVWTCIVRAGGGSDKD